MRKKYDKPEIQIITLTSGLSICETSTSTLNVFNAEDSDNYYDGEIY